MQKTAFSARYRGQKNHTLCVFMGYCPNPSTRPLPVYSQPHTHLLQQQDTRCPRDPFLQDITKEEAQNCWDHVILLDGNMNIKQGKLPQALQDAMLIQISSDNVTALTKWGSGWTLMYFHTNGRKAMEEYPFPLKDQSKQENTFIHPAQKVRCWLYSVSFRLLSRLIRKQASLQWYKFWQGLLWNKIN